MGTSQRLNFVSFQFILCLFLLKNKNSNATIFSHHAFVDVQHPGHPELMAPPPPADVGDVTEPLKLNTDKIQTKQIFWETSAPTLVKNHPSVKQELNAAGRCQQRRHHGTNYTNPPGATSLEKDLSHHLPSFYHPNPTYPGA